MGRYYSFRRRHPVPYTGHTHLAGLAYTVVSVGLFAQVLAFAIHHVYSAILIDIEERTGVLSSIFSGYKNIRTHKTVESRGLGGEAPEGKGRHEQADRADA